MRARSALCVISSLAICVGLVSCTPPPEPIPEPEAVPLSNEISSAHCIWITSSLQVIDENLQLGDVGLVVAGLAQLSSDAGDFSEEYSGDARDALESLSRSTRELKTALESGSDAPQEAKDEFMEVGLKMNSLC